jgi:hypothetical protein
VQALSHPAPAQAVGVEVGDAVETRLDGCWIEKWLAQPALQKARAHCRARAVNDIDQRALARPVTAGLE